MRIEMMWYESVKFVDPIKFSFKQHVACVAYNFFSSILVYHFCKHAQHFC